MKDKEQVILSKPVTTVGHLWDWQMEKDERREEKANITGEKKWSREVSKHKKYKTEKQPCFCPYSLH